MNPAMLDPMNNNVKFVPGGGFAPVSG